MPRRTALALLLLLAATPGFAASLLTVRSTVEGLQMEQPQTEIRIWIDGDKLRRDEGDTSYILRLDRNKLYVVNHSEKTYSELAVPIDPEKVSTGPVPQSKVQITQTEETKKVGSGGWNARRYKLDIANPGGVHLDTTIWASKDIASYAAFNRLSVSMMALQPGSADLSRKLGQLDGFPVLQESNVEVGTNHFKTREELVSVGTQEAPAGTFEPPADYTAQPYTGIAK
jgi:hypothetical protein